MDQFKIQEQAAMQMVADILGKALGDYPTVKYPQVVSSDIDLLLSASQADKEHEHQQICTWFDGAANELKHEAGTDWTESLEPYMLLFQDFLIDDIAADDFIVDAVPDKLPVIESHRHNNPLLTSISTMPHILPDIAELDFAWIPPTQLKRDTLQDFGADLLIDHESSDSEVTCIQERNDTQYHHRRLIFTQHDISRLTDINAWLNDICINQCASLLYHYCDSPAKQRCAIFSSFDINTIRQDSVKDPLWRGICHTEFWRRPIWLIPIHRNNHWLLCVVDTRRRELICFDSFGDPTPWQESLLKVC